MVAAIIEIDGKYVAGRRAPHKASGGLWEFPGGKIEQNEEPSEALVREIYEELGISIAVGKLFHKSQTEFATHTIELTCFLATSESIPLSSTDHDRLELLAAEHLGTRNWSEADIPALKSLQLSKVSSLQRGHDSWN